MFKNDFTNNKNKKAYNNEHNVLQSHLNHKLFNVCKLNTDIILK